MFQAVRKSERCWCLQPQGQHGTSLESCSDVNTLPVAVPSHLLVSHLFFFSVSSHILPCLSVTTSDNGLFGGRMPPFLCLVIVPFFCQSNLMSVTEMVATVQEYPLPVSTVTFLRCVADINFKINMYFQKAIKFLSFKMYYVCLCTIYKEKSFFKWFANYCIAFIFTFFTFNIPTFSTDTVCLLFEITCWPVQLKEHLTMSVLPLLECVYVCICVCGPLCSLALYLSVNGVMTSLSVQPKNSFW